MKKGRLLEWAQNLVKQSRISAEDSAAFVAAVKAAPLKRLAEGLVSVQPALNPEWVEYNEIPSVFIGTFEDGHTETISYKRVAQTRPSYIKRKFQGAVTEDVQAHRLVGHEIHHTIMFSRIVLQYMNHLISTGRFNNSLDEVVDMCHRKDLQEWREFHKARFVPQLLTRTAHAEQTAQQVGFIKRAKRQWKEWDSE